jgi:cytochrome c-type biogenesis protein CcmH/NrfG
VAGVDAYRQDRLEAARELLEEAVALAPGEARSWYYLGEIHRAQGSDNDARAAYQRCVALDPDHGRALDRLAESDSSAR